MRGKIIGLVLAALMLALGGFWTAVGLGWVGNGEESSAMATVGPLVGGLGVALVIVVLQKRH